MENKIIDARGLACPMPVIKTKKALESFNTGSITTVVDNEAAKENIIALAKSLGCDVEVEQKDNEYHIRTTKLGCDLTAEETETGNIVIMVTAAELGRGSSELGTVLIRSFLVTLVESSNLPNAMLFVNGGVFLTCENSPVLEHLLTLRDKGVEIVSCGTCLDYYKLKEKLCVGQISNMYTIYEKMANASKVITL